MKQSGHCTKVAFGILLRAREGSEACGSRTPLSFNSVDGRDELEPGKSRPCGLSFSISVACLMLDIGFFPPPSSIESRLSAFVDVVGISASRRAPRVLCLGLGATKISVSGLISTALVDLVGGFVSSACESGCCGWSASAIKMIG